MPLEYLEFTVTSASFAFSHLTLDLPVAGSLLVIRPHLNDHPLREAFPDDSVQVRPAVQPQSLCREHFLCGMQHWLTLLHLLTCSFVHCLSFFFSTKIEAQESGDCTFATYCYVLSDEKSSGTE